MVFVINVLVLSNMVRLLSIRSFLALGINRSRGQLLESNRSLDRILYVTVNSDFHVNLASGLLRGKGLFTLTNHRLVCLINQFRIQGVLLPWDQVLVFNGVSYLSAGLNCLALIQLGLGGNLWVPDGIYGLCLVAQVLVLSNDILLVRIRGGLSFRINLSRGQSLKGDCCVNRLLKIAVNSDLHVHVTRGLFWSKGLLALADDLVVPSLILQLSIKGVFLVWDQILIVNRVLYLCASNNLVSIVGKLCLGANLWLQLLLRSTSSWSRFTRLSAWLSSRLLRRRFLRGSGLLSRGLLIGRLLFRGIRSALFLRRLVFRGFFLRRLLGGRGFLRLVLLGIR